MADNDVGGIGVKFTAEAAQLQQELQKLEQRLKQFDSAHGQKKVRLQAELVMPGNRALADFRRDLEKGFGSQGAAGRVKARIELIPPTASEIKALTGKIGDVKVKVVGNFEWGKAPPKTITVKVVEEGTGRPAAGSSRVTQTQAVAQAASGGRSARAAAPKKTTVAPGGPRVGNAELFADYKDSGALLADYLDSYRKGGSRVWMGKARDELIRRGMTRDQIVAIEQGAKRPTGGSRGFVSQFMGSPIPSTSAAGIRPPGGAQIKAMQRAGQLPLPYADAGLYHPAFPPSPLKRAPGQKALELPPEEWLERRLDQILKLTPQNRLKSGGEWWKQSGQLIGGMAHGTGMTAPQAAGVAAQMTTRLSWPETLKTFDTFSMRVRAGIKDQADLFRGMQVMGREQRQITAILASSGTEEAVESIIRGPKGTGSPKLAEMYGGFLGRPNAFPFDAHMQRLMLGGEIPTRLIPKARDWATGSLRRRGMQPSSVMPAIWETAGGGDVFGADPHGQLRAGGPRGFAGGDPYADLARILGTGGARGFLNAAPRPLPPRGRTGFDASGRTALRLSSAGSFAQGVGEPPVHQVDPRRLVPFRELDRERVPRLRARVQFGPGGPQSSTEPFDSGYLSSLTAAIKEGIREPLRLEYDEAGFAQLTDGNHRLAGALRIVNEGLESFTVPVQAFPARGLLTGNTGRIRTPNATDVPGIIGAGGPRGFTGSPFGDPFSRSGSPAAVGGTGDIQRWLEDQGRQMGQMRRMAEELKADWGGFSMDPRTGRMMGPEPGRRQGPWLSSVGRTVRVPKEAAQDPEQLRAAIEQLKADPYNARLLRQPNSFIGGFNSPERPDVDLDVSLRDETAQAAMRRQIARGAQSRGAYNVATGTGLFGPENAYGVPATRIPGLGQPTVTGAGTFSGRRFASKRDLAAAMATPLAAPPTAGTDLDVPTFIRQQGKAIADAIQQRAAAPIAAESGGLQEFLNPPVAPPPGPDDEVGRPSVSARALARAGLDPSGKPFSAEEGSPQARVQQLLKSSREAVQLAQGTGQVRAVGTTTGGLFANLLGGKAQRELVARDLTTLRHALEGFTAEGTDAHTAFSRVTEAQTRFNQATLTGTGNVQALGKQLQEAQQAAQPYVETVEAIGGQINKLQGQINPLKQATVGFASSIAGTIVGLGIFNSVSAGIEGIGNALKEPSDRLLGFRRIGEQTGLALGQATRQMHGFTDGAVSATAAQSGLGDSVIGQIRPLLQQRAAVEAGNTAFREQLDLIRSAGFFGRNPGAGITQTTGGLLGTPIGGQQPFLEQLLQSGSPVGGPLESRAGRVGLNAAAGAATGAALGTLIPIPGLSTVTGAIAGGLIGGASGLLQTADQPESVTLGARARSGDLTEDETQRLGEFSAALATINDGLEKANPKLKETAHFVELLGNTGPAANEAVAATQKLLSEIPGITKDQLQAAKDLRFALIDPKTGGAARVAPQGLQRVLTEALRGVSLPSRQEAAFQTARGLTASLDLNQQQNRLQRETIIPGQSFLRQLFAGRAPTGRQVNIGDPLRQGTASLPPEILNRPGIDTSQLSAGLGQVETQANAGREALVGMIKTADNLNQRAGISSNLLGTFNELTEAAGKTAATIRGISQASAWMQVNLQVKQINEQIFVMSRSLEDARSFLSGAGTGELGLLQNRARSLDIAQAELGFRQQSLGLANQELGITATTLQLQQRQRQINFQRAIAGFVTPGQTPEEIAARQQEAKLEADFAQRQQDIGVKQLDNQRETVSLAREQLGISREQFAIQQAMIQVSAERAVGDLSRGIALLQEQAQVTVQLQVNSDAIAAYQEVLEEQKAQIESVIQEAYSVQQQVMSNAAALAAQYGGRITEWNNILIKALADYVGRAGAVLMGFNEQVAGQYAGQFGQTGTTGVPGSSGAGGSRATASGYYGNVSGATQFTVGEAGPETVAIIRNPRSMMWNGGGKGGEGVNINITVTGNNVGSEQDADELAATIARKVEETMSRRSSLLGMRTN